MSFLSWGAQKRTQYLRCGLTRAEYTSLVLLATLFLIQARMPLAFLATWTHCWLMFSRLLTSTPRSFSAGQLSSHSSPSLWCCMRLLWPKCRTWHNLFSKACTTLFTVYNKVCDMHFVNFTTKSTLNNHVPTAESSKCTQTAKPTGTCEGSGWVSDRFWNRAQWVLLKDFLKKSTSFTALKLRYLNVSM